MRQKRPNPLGLYDLHGNAWEWVRDGYGNASEWVQGGYGNYQAGTFVDPEESVITGGRVLRGGSFRNPPEELRSAFRLLGIRVYWILDPGFRCVRVPPQN